MFPVPPNVKFPTLPEDPEAVQANVTPLPTLELNVTGRVDTPEQTDWGEVTGLGLAITVGAGLTVITCVPVVPGHPPMDGVIV